MISTARHFTLTGPLSVSMLDHARGTRVPFDQKMRTLSKCIVGELHRIPVHNTVVPPGSGRYSSENESAEPAYGGLEEALRTWRLTEARRRGIPAFRIFTDQALRAMVSKRPETDRELLAIPGIGMTTVKQYGPQIYRIIHGSSV
jgi:superfamily II DNA helicase RecQ